MLKFFFSVILFSLAVLAVQSINMVENLGILQGQLSLADWFHFVAQ